jgi:hypothetical protein
VIKRVTLIDATGRGPEPNMTVIADGGRIVAVGPWRKTHVPRKAVVVDGTGKFLIPGLWDMHVHGASDARAPWSHLLFLANGVVGVRDMWGPPDAHAWRATQASNEDPSPAIFLGSPVSVIPRRQSCAYPACITRIAIRPHRGLGSNDPGLELPITCDYQIDATQWRRRAKEKATYTFSRQSKYLAHSHII